jgi:hypothetical protein
MVHVSFQNPIEDQNGKIVLSYVACDNVPFHQLFTPTARTSAETKIQLKSESYYRKTVLQKGHDGVKFEVTKMLADMQKPSQKRLKNFCFSRRICHLSITNTIFAIFLTILLLNVLLRMIHNHQAMIHIRM